MLSVSFQILKEWEQAGKDFLLIDVRETFEHEEFHIGGLNIPLGELMSRLGQLPPEKDIVLYCAKGIRSAIGVQRLEEKGYTHVYNMENGVAALKHS